MEWQCLPNAPLIPNNEFVLWNIQVGKYVAYGEREYGINLVWYERMKKPSPSFTFSRDGSPTDPIRYGETVALRESKGGYIYYAKRDNGINLKWSREPVYEWQVTGGQAGEAVTMKNPGDSPRYISDTSFDLYNVPQRSLLAYGERSRGINLVWKR